MPEALRANTSSKSAISLQQGPVDPKFQVEGVAPSPTEGERLDAAVRPMGAKDPADPIFMDPKRRSLLSVPNQNST